MEKFKIGDRVKHKYYGLGIVKKINMNLALPYGILLDNGDIVLCSNACLIEFEPKYKTIVINLEGNTVTAYMGNHKAVAKCSPDDEFDLYKGAVWAITRLLVEGKIDG